MSGEERLYDPTTEFCSLYHHSTVIINDVLFILQGYASYIRNGSRKAGNNPHLRSIDLNTPIPVARSGEFINVQTNRTLYPENLPSTINPAVWWHPSASTLTMAMGGTVNYQGLIYQDSSKFNPGNSGEMWIAGVQTRPGSGPIDEPPGPPMIYGWESANLNLEGQTGIITSRNSYFDDELKTGWIVGGSVRSSPTNSFITYKSETGTWTNSTLPWGTTHGNSAMGSFRINGRLIFVHVGGSIDGVFVTMDQARIYDTETEQWFTQEILGPRPDPRGDPCTAVVAAPDGSSFQFLMFGGSSDASREGQYNSELWALNIPSFTWIRLDNSREGNAPGTRSGASCNILKDHILMVYGGKKAFIASQAPQCELNGNAAYFMDLNTLEWLDTYQGNRTTPGYRVPSPVYSAIGGNAAGGATLIAPPDGFKSEVLATIFTINGTRSLNPNVTPVSTSESTSRAPNENSPPQFVPVGAIAGGIVGGLLLLAFGFIVVLYMRKKRTGSYWGKDEKDLGSSDDIPIGGRAELPPNAEGFTYHQHLTVYKDSAGYQNMAFTAPQVQQGYFYELPASDARTYSHVELESPLSQVDSQHFGTLDTLVDTSDLPLPPTPPSAPQPQA
ncbi:hypothetical protein TWF281_005393 [Arthrobotrys megalospora]